MGIEHAGILSRRAYFEKRARRAATMPGLEVTEIEPEVIELGSLESA